MLRTSLISSWLCYTKSSDNANLRWMQSVFRFVRTCMGADKLLFPLNWIRPRIHHAVTASASHPRLYPERFACGFAVMQLSIRVWKYFQMLSFVPAVHACTHHGGCWLLTCSYSLQLSCGILLWKLTACFVTAHTALGNDDIYGAWTTGEPPPHECWAHRMRCLMFSEKTNCHQRLSFARRQMSNASLHKIQKKFYRCEQRFLCKINY